MNVRETALPGVLVVEPKVHGDARGYFVETYQDRRYEEAGIPARFVQDNRSFSRRGILRGLHWQCPNPQGKLLSVVEGEIFDVAVDVRRDSPTFGRWVAEVLTGENHRQLWVPEGFAHGFLVLSETAHVVYKVTDYYRPEAEKTLRWDDAEVGIEWPFRDVQVNAKDAAGRALSSFTDDELFAFQPAEAPVRSGQG